MPWASVTRAQTAKAAQAMKFQHAVALTLPSKPCQCPGCSNLGRRRLQKHGRIIRSLYLCDWCLESLLAIHINDLFVKFGGIPKDRCPARRKVPRLNRQRETECIFP